MRCRALQQSSWPQCKRSKPCPAGRFTTQSGIVSPSCTDVCGAGTYGDESGKGSASEACKDCPSGKYWNQNNQFHTECKLCPIGRAIVTTGSSQCAICGAGKFTSQQGRIECENCPAGKFKGAASTSLCTSCPAGKWMENTGALVCTECLPGRFRTQEGEINPCNLCPAGK